MRQLKPGEILAPTKQDAKLNGYRIWIIKESSKGSSWVKTTFVPIVEKCTVPGWEIHEVSISVEKSNLIRTTKYKVIKSIWN